MGVFPQGLKAAFSGSYTGAPLNLAQPTEDSYDFANEVNEDFRIINSSWNTLTTSTGSLQQQLNTLATTYVDIAGDKMTGALETTSLTASSGTFTSHEFSIGGSTFTVEGGSITINRLQTKTSIASDYGGTGANMATAAQGAIPYFSATGVQSALAVGTAGQVLQSGGASANPSWTSSSLTEKQGYVKDNFIGQVNGVATVFNLTSTPTAAGAVSVVLDGLLQSSTSDYTYSTAGQIVTMNTAPAANSYSFYVAYSTGVTFIQTDGDNCSAGQYARGVDAGGNAQNCTTAGDVTTTVANTMSGNNRFSGNNTHSGTTSLQGAVYISATSTIGPQGYASAVTKSSGTFNNMWLVVASSFTTASSTLTYTGMASDRRYRYHWNFTKNTAGYIYIRLGGDVGSNYRYVVGGRNSNGNAAAQSTSNSATFCGTSGNSLTAIGANEISDGNFEAGFSYVNGTTVTLNGLHSFVDGNPFLYGQHFHCQYKGASVPSSLSFNASAGTFTGYSYVEELIVPNP